MIHGGKIWTWGLGLLGASGGMGLLFEFFQEALRRSDPASLDDASLFGLIKYLVVTIPALAILGIQIWINSKAQATRDKQDQDAREAAAKREEEREKRASEERKDLLRDYTETAKSSLLALTEHSKVIKDLADTVRQSQGEIVRGLDDLSRRRSEER